MSDLLRKQLPEPPKTPQSPLESFPPTHDAMNLDKDEQSTVTSEEQKTTNPSKFYKRPQRVSFKPGGQLTLFAPKPADTYDRRPVATPQFLRQQDLKKRRKLNEDTDTHLEDSDASSTPALNQSLNF
jgi:hypothetical protein